MHITSLVNKNKIRYNKSNPKMNSNRHIWENFTPIKSVNLFRISDTSTGCRAVNIDGDIIFYNWDNHVDREIVYNTASDDVLVFVDPDVKRGWDVYEFKKRSAY